MAFIILEAGNTGSTLPFAAIATTFTSCVLLYGLISFLRTIDITNLISAGSYVCTTSS